MTDAGRLRPNPGSLLADFTAGLRWEMVPAAVRQRVKDLIIDALGCALAAARSEELAQVEGFCRSLGGEGASSVAGDPGRYPLGSAAVLNAYRITALTACDVYTPAHLHVTPEVVPPALAIAERDGADGRRFLAAVAVGLEVTTRVAAGLDYPAFRGRGWHSPGVAGPLGGAATVASLLGLEAGRVRNALGLGASQAAGTWAAWGTPTVKFHQARAALSGLMAGLLAETGFTAAEDVLTDPDGGLLNSYSGGGRPEALTDALGARWEAMGISLRLWPGATPLQPVITGLARLRETRPAAFREVRRLRIAVAPAVLRQHAAFRHPRGTFEAMLSLHHASAAMLRFGRLGFDEFEAPAYTDPQIRHLVDEVIEVVDDPALTPLACRVEAVDAEGQTAAIHITVPRGHPDDPAGQGEVDAKFLACAHDVLDEDVARRLLERLRALEDVADVGEIGRLLRPTRHPARQPMATTA